MQCSVYLWRTTLQAINGWMRTRRLELQTNRLMIITDSLLEFGTEACHDRAVQCQSFCEEALPGVLGDTLPPIATHCVDGHNSRVLRG
eukprot:1981218-Amphidinium_carterae.3